MGGLALLAVVFAVLRGWMHPARLGYLQAGPEADPSEALHVESIPPFRPADSLIAVFLEDTGAPGVSAAAGRDGELVWRGAAGWADPAAGTPFRTSTRLRIGSISKPVTAVALGLLAEEGRLGFDDEVQPYVPAFPADRRGVTVRRVAGHLAGIRSYRPGEYHNERHYATVDDALAVFRNDPLEHAPGEAFLYSSLGWTLLAAVIEGASGTTYLDFMEQRLFRPLGMNRTGAETAPGGENGQARYFRKNRLGMLRDAPYVDNSLKWAGGGFVSTAEDLVRFGNAVLDGTVLEPETVELLFASQQTRAGVRTNYGIGWASMHREGRFFVGHTGEAVGASTVLIIEPATRVVAVVLCNLQGPDMVEVGVEMVDLFRSARPVENEAERTNGASPR